MAVCKFFLEGRCKFGSDCRFQHPSGRSAFGGRGGSNSARGGHREQREEHGNSIRLFSGNHYFGDDRRGYQEGRERGDQGGRGRGGNRGGGWGGGRGGGWSSGSWSGDGGGRGGGNWGGGGWSGGGGKGGGWSNQTKNRSENWSKGGRNQSGEGRKGWGRQEGKWTGDTDTMSPNDIATEIRKDLEEWMSSVATMWPLSCYGNKDATGCLPGLIDVSPDELRWEAYQANATNTSSKYLQVLKELSLKQLNVMGKYRQITAEDVQLLQSNPGVVNDSIWSLSTTKQDNSNPGGLFGPLNSGSSLPSNSIFGPPSSSLLFEGQKPLSQSLFGPSDSGQQTGSSLFSAPESVAPGCATGQVDSKTIAGGLFGSQSPQTSSMQPFPGDQSLGTTTTHAQVSASTQGDCTTSVSNPGQKALKTVLNYTQTSELTKSELEAYKADKFVLGQIPEHAPVAAYNK